MGRSKIFDVNVRVIKTLPLRANGEIGENFCMYSKGKIYRIREKFSLLKYFVNLSIAEKIHGKKTYSTGANGEIAKNFLMMKISTYMYTVQCIDQEYLPELNIIHCLALPGHCALHLLGQ